MQELFCFKLPEIMWLFHLLKEKQIWHSIPAQITLTLNIRSKKHIASRNEAIIFLKKLYLVDGVLHVLLQTVSVL